MKRIGAFICAAICCLSILSIFLCGCSDTVRIFSAADKCEFGTSGEEYTEKIKAGETALLEDQSSRLTMDESGVLRLYDCEGTLRWASAVSESSSLEQVFDQQTAYSAASILYQTNRTVDKVLDSYSEAIQKEQYRVSVMDQTAIVELILGEYTENIMLPAVLSQTRFDELLGRMSDTDAAFLRRQYAFYTPQDAQDDPSLLKSVPNLTEQPFYVLMSVPGQTKKRRISDLFTAAGYTKEDLQTDQQAAGISAAADSVVFKVQLEFTLDNGDLVVRIPCDKVYFPDDMPILTINLLKYSLFSMFNTDGYYMLPSGSGALFHFDAGKEKPYSLQYYGADYTSDKIKTTADAGACPVFGYTDGESGFLAIVETGAEAVTMQIENVKTGYILYPQIQLLETQTSQLGTSKAFTLYEPRPFDGDVTIRYRFLEGKNAGYAGMANSYREYLEERHVFPETAVDDTPFLLEIINSIYMTRNVAGISYTAEEVVTSFETAGEILSWFTENDCTNLQVKLNGANKNGLFVQTPGKFYTSGKAGGNDALRDFQDLCRNSQIPCYLSVMFPFYYADHLFDGYSSSSMTAREINNKEAEIYYKEKSSLEIRTDLPALQVVSPTLYTRFASQYVQGQATLGEGVSVGEFTRIINSDFAVNRYCSRSQSRVNIEESLHQLSTCYQLTGENANVYTWRYLRLNEKVPTGSTGYSCMDRDIPFLQMVMHGRLAYTVPCFNSQADDREALLKAIETGSGLYFRLAETVDKDVMGTQNSFLYNVEFDLWKDIAVSHNAYVRTALDGLASVAMIDHTYLTDTLVCVTYENGVKLYINYAEKDAEADGLTVPGLSYIRV